MSAVEKLLAEWEAGGGEHIEIGRNVYRAFAEEMRAAIEADREGPDLRGFVIALIDAHLGWDGHAGDLDGGTFQDLAEKHGVFVVERATAPCDEELCICAEYGDWPVDCYRTHPSLIVPTASPEPDKETP